MDIWNLDDIETYSNEWREWLSKKGYNKGKHEKFFVGKVITFWTGYNNNLRAQAKIKGINGNDIYVYNDSYWYPIQDDDTRKIEIV